MIQLIILINIAAFALTLLRGLPRPFPWTWSALLGYVLLLSGFASPLLKIERAVGYVTLLSVIIITAHVLPHVRKGEISLVFNWTATVLAAFLLLDAFRLFSTPDVALTPGETFELIRRPYLLEHPNVKASWLLLLTLSPVTLIGLSIAQSRGALMGYLAALLRFTPRRYYIVAALAGAAVITMAAFIRPGTFFGRVDIWADGLRIFLEHPWFGAGTGTFHSLTVTGMSTAHNIFITIAAENGLLGLFVFIAWLVALVPLIVRSTNPMKFNLLAFAVQQLVDDQWLHVVSAILLGLVIGITLFQKEDQ